MAITRRVAREQDSPWTGGAGVHRAVPVFVDRHRLLGDACPQRELAQGFLPRRLRGRLHGLGAHAVRDAVQRQHAVCVHRQDVSHRLRLANERAFHDVDHRRLSGVCAQAASLGQARDVYHAGGLSRVPFFTPALHGVGVDHDGAGDQQLSAGPIDSNGVAVAGHDRHQSADGIRRGGDFTDGDHAGVRNAGRLSSGGLDGHDSGRHPYDRVRDPAVRRTRPLWWAGKKLRATAFCRTGKGGRAGCTHKPAMVQLHHRRGTGWRVVSAGNPTHLRRTQPESASKRCGHDGVPATNGFADRGAGWRHGGRLDRTVAGFTNQCRVGPGVQRSLSDRDGKIGPAQMADRGVACSRTRGANVHRRLRAAIGLINADQGHLPPAGQPERK